jgi:hypothetical protein
VCSTHDADAEEEERHSDDGDGARDREPCAQRNGIRPEGSQHSEGAQGHERDDEKVQPTESLARPARSRHTRLKLETAPPSKLIGRPVTARVHDRTVPGAR